MAVQTDRVAYDFSTEQPASLTKWEDVGIVAVGAGGTGADHFDDARTKIGRSLSVERIFLPSVHANGISSSNLVDIEQAVREGRIVVLSFKPRLDGVNHTWADVEAGSLDDELGELGERIDALHHTVYLSFHHEPENDKGDFGSASDYRDAWAHVVSTVEAAGATNIRWTVILMGDTYESGDGNLWNANAVTDVIGVDRYDYHGCKNNAPAGTHDGDPSFSYDDFDGLFGDAADYAVSKGKPLLIAEVGAAFVHGQSSARPDWIGRFRSDLVSRNATSGNDVVGAAYFWHDYEEDGQGQPTVACDFKTDRNQGELDAWKDMLDAQRFA